MDEIDWKSFGIDNNILKDGLKTIIFDWPRFLMFFLVCGAILYQIQSELYWRANLAEAYMPLIKAGQACRDQAYSAVLPSCDIRIGDIVLLNYKTPNLINRTLWLPMATPPT